MKKGMVLTDLDGTLLNNQGLISAENLATLELLGKKGVTRVAATGRNIKSAREVLNYDLPFDYLIFSTGAGICTFAEDHVIHSNHLHKEDIHEVGRFFLANDLDFSIHHPIPENHCFFLFPSSSPTADLTHRLKYLQQYAHKSDLHEIDSATQLLAITLNGLEIIDKLQSRFSHLNIIRTTSPIDGRHIWIEVFPSGVSKGLAAEWLCQHLNIDRSLTMSIGNDFNDLAMLEWTHSSFTVANAPLEMRKCFDNVSDNNSNGFSEAVEIWLKKSNL